MKLIEAASKIFFSRVGQVLANAAVVMIIAKVLGPEGQGYYSLTITLALLLSAMLGGGMGLAAVPPLRRNLVSASRMLKAQLMWAAGMTVLLLVIAYFSMGGRLADVLADHLGWSAGFGFMAAMAAVALLGFDIFSYDLLARGRLLVGAAVNGSRAVGHLVFILVLWAFGGVTLGWAIGIHSLAFFLGTVVMLVILLREIRQPSQAVQIPQTAEAAVPIASIPTDKDDDLLPKDLGQRSLLGLVAFNLRRGWLGQFSLVAYTLLMRLDQGLLVHFRDAAEVGIYSVAVYVGEMLWLLPQALTPLLVHSSAADSADPDRDRTALRAVRIGLLVTLAIGIPLYILAGPLLSLLAGGQYAASGASLRALLPGIVAFAPAAVLAGDFIGRGKPHWNTQASIVTLIINVMAALYLIPRHGAVGAGWASSIAYSCGSVMMLTRFQLVTGLKVISFRR